MKPSKPAIINPHGTATPTPIATEWFEGVGGGAAIDDAVAGGAADDSITWAVEDGDAELDVEELGPNELGAGSITVAVVVIRVVIDVVEEELLVVAAPITPIVVRAEGVPASLVSALRNLEGIIAPLP
jgi:hypothetical protein